MRFVAPSRAATDAAVFERPPLAQWHEFRDLLSGPEWPLVAALNEFGAVTAPRFVSQSPDLLSEGVHYEQRIADRGEIATRECNWHDLLNALIWLRYPQLKSALNARQVSEIAVAGPKARTRAQCALTLFDEGGIVVLMREPELRDLWDVHDWHGLFWRERNAWLDGRLEAIVFGHALLEHALKPHQLLVGKAIGVTLPRGTDMESRVQELESALAEAIREGKLLNDPQELRPLPLSGIPGWCEENASEDFYRTAACFRPVRPGRRYPAPFSSPSGGS